MLRFLTLLCCGAWVCAAGPAGSSRWRQDEKLAIRGVKVLSTDLACWKRFELAVDLTGSYATPFDPDEIAMDAEFSLPSGRIMIVPGFFFQAFSRVRGANGEEMKPTSSPEWRIRFLPPAPGSYSVKILARDRSGLIESAPVRFEARPAPGHGYIRVSGRDPHYFEYQDGTPFFAIGENMVSGSIEEYQKWIPSLGRNGGNFARLWIGNPALALELGTLGEYRLDNASRLDEVMELSEQFGIHQKMTFDWVRHITPPPPPEHRPKNFSLPDYAYREDYAYRTENGGPCHSMRDIFTLPEARRLFKARIRYTVARWGYSSSVMGWELWNEMNAIDSSSGANKPETVLPWNQEMCRYLKLVDPYQHLTTNSLGGYWPEMWQMPENEFAQIHGYYGWHQPEDEYNARDMFLFMTKRLSQIQNYRKPFLFAEFGIMFNRPLIQDLPRDPEGVHFHNGLWAPLAFGAAGTGQEWGWRNVDTNNLYSHFRALAEFTKDIPWTMAGFRKAGAQTSRQELRVMGLQGRMLTILWVENAAHTWWNAIHASPAPAVENASLEVAGITAARCRVEYWDTYDGRITRTAEAQSLNGFLRIQLPVVERDLAIKIIALNGTTETQSNH